VDNKEVAQDTILLTKGIHSLVVLDSSDNVSSFNYEEIKNISDSIFIDKLEKEIIKESSNYYIRLSNTDLIKAYNLLDTEEFSIFIENNKTTEYIENIQLKAELKSNDTKTCPFISKIIVRGI
jgi:trehalose/maltose hydrolase-like predicted phosphorylase